MEQAIKIKSEKWIPQIGIPVLILSVILMLIGVVMGELSVQYLLACVMALMALLHLIFTVTTRNFHYLIPLAFYLFAALTFFSVLYFPPAIWGFVVLAGISFAGFMWVLFSRKIKWRHREVLELAARSVTETADGFTARPYPAGAANFTRQQLNDFAKFLRKHTIAYPVFEKKRVVLVPSNLLVWMLRIRRNYETDSFIALNYDGPASVKITKTDYQQYTEKFTFDQLCDAFGNLFKHFFYQFQSGKSQQIIKQMNALKLIV